MISNINEYNSVFRIDYSKEAKETSTAAKRWEITAYTAAALLSSLTLYLTVSVCTAGLSNLITGAYLAAIGIGSQGIMRTTYIPAKKRQLRNIHKLEDLQGVLETANNLPDDKSIYHKYVAHFYPLHNIDTIKPTLAAYEYWKKKSTIPIVLKNNSYHYKVKAYNYTEDVTLDAKVKAAYFYYILKNPTSKLHLPKIHKVDDRVRAHEYGGHNKGPYFETIDKSEIMANSIFTIASMIETLDQG